MLETQVGGGVFGLPPPENFEIWRHRNVIFNILNEIFTGMPVVQPSYEMGSVFPSGTNCTLACSAHVQDMRVCVEPVSGLQQSTFY